MDEERERRLALEKAEYFGALITAQFAINGSVKLHGREYERFVDAAEVILGVLYKERTAAYELYFILSLQSGNETSILEAREIADKQFVGAIRKASEVPGMDRLSGDDEDVKEMFGIS